MHLLLGFPHDPCCAGVLARLEARGLPAGIVAAPLAAPARFVWRLDGTRLSSRLAWGDAPAAEIAGVLIRDTGWLDPEGWDPADHAYMQAETQAATLAWLAGLDCPVVNRCDAALWYRGRAPLLAWRPLLRRCGLVSPDVLVTNGAAEARAFARSAGAVYAPLTGEAGYLVATEADWRGLAAVQDRAPVCLAEPHGRVQPACLVGEAIVWGGDPPAEAAALEPALRRFAAEAGLAFVEIGVAAVRRGLGVVMVDAVPRIEHFGPAERARILDTLVDLLAPKPARPRVLPGVAP